ncbi:hypothetical protein [Paenibacillus sp. FSL R5-0701]|uniref:hypothetical protein n=1 Tax=Paenibacillus sp. FSL R5-0701 TaxID=2921654 RepID=UPI0030CB45FF
MDELGESGESLIVGVGVYLIRGSVNFNEPETSNSGAIAEMENVTNLSEVILLKTL